MRENRGMNIINGFLTIPGQIQIDLNLGTPGIIETDKGYLIQLPDMRTEIALRKTSEGYTGELTSKGMGATVVFDVGNIDGFLRLISS